MGLIDDFNLCHESSRKAVFLVLSNWKKGGEGKKVWGKYASSAKLPDTRACLDKMMRKCLCVCVSVRESVRVSVCKMAFQ